MEEELEEWVHDARANATEMHVCFYEGWCREKDISMAYGRVERMVRELAARIKSSGF